MNTIVSVKGLHWPPKLSFISYSELLGPRNNLGRFRWYFKFRYYLDQSCSLICFKVDSHLKVIAVGRAYYDHLLPADFESQRFQLIAKCIRGARPL